MPNHPYGGRVQGYLDRLQQQRAEFFDPSSRKRPAPEEPTDGLDANKRQRLSAELPSQPTQFAVPPPLPPGPVSFAQLFTLTQEPSQKSFDVQAIPFDLVQRIVVPILGAVRQEQLEHAMNVRLPHLYTFFNSCLTLSDSCHYL
jgi:symplekin